MASRYNRSGQGVRDHYAENDDPCGYMTNNPCEFLMRINELIEVGLQKATEISEGDSTHEQQGRAWQVYNLAREMAARAGRSPVGKRPEWVVRIEKVVNSIG